MKPKFYFFRKKLLKRLVIRLIKNINKWTGFVAVLLLQIYKYHISSALNMGGNCRFYPSCSDYAIQVYQRHSFLKASRLILFRLLNCHPFSPLWMNKSKIKHFLQRDCSTPFLHTLNKKVKRIT